MSAPTIADAWEQFQQARVPIDVTHETLMLIRRAYYTDAIAESLRSRRDRPRRRSRRLRRQRTEAVGTAPCLT